MSLNYNRSILGGNLVADPILRETPGNQSVVNFTIASNRTYKTKDGKKQEETAFVNCELWGEKAKTFNTYMKKGRPVLVEGRLKQDNWEDKDGNKRSKIVIAVEDFRFVDSNSKSETSNNSAASTEPLEGEDIPF